MWIQRKLLALTSLKIPLITAISNNWASINAWTEHRSTCALGGVGTWSLLCARRCKEYLRHPYVFVGAISFCSLSLWLFIVVLVHCRTCSAPLIPNLILFFMCFWSQAGKIFKKLRIDIKKDELWKEKHKTQIFHMCQKRKFRIALN